MKRLIITLLVITLLAVAGCDDTTTPASTQPPTQPPVEPTGEDAACTNAAIVVESTTLADGTVVLGGEMVEKSWVIENTGTCTWDSSYTLIQIGGGFLQAVDAETPLPEVGPGEQTTITIPMTLNSEAPLNSEQEAVFQIRSPEGDQFGETPYALITVGSDADVVPTPTPRSG
ncbi:MAG: hypothetical protein GYB64_05075 [Chloroflexi bacterium]|nr:hypothetical protein [Chloroflexota bacterium]